MKTTPKKIEILLKTPTPRLGPGEALGVTGSCPELGNWKEAVIMGKEGPIFAALILKVSEPFEYKFVVADKYTSRIKYWEEGGNRYADLSRESIIAPPARINAPKWRGAGTAIPVFALRSEEDFGIGEFHDLKKMVDWAVKTGQSIIQLLPINDTTMTGTWQDSYPYNANSTFALHPQFIHLPAAGVPENKEYKKLQQELNALDKVDYEKVNNEKTRLLKKAFAKVGAETAAKKDYKDFIKGNSYWLLPYAAFRVLTSLNGTPEFSSWGKYSKYSPAIVEELSKTHKEEIDFHCFEQYHLYKQFAQVKEYARNHGVMLKGDLPIGISRTSADAWLHPELFNMDSQAGAPPDAFSVQGQNWGFPTYNWERMAKDKYAWWKARLGKMAECFDAFRIDHILGFFRIWEIPADSVRGLMGHFNPALPYSKQELLEKGFDISGGRYISPNINDSSLRDIFGDRAGEVREKCIRDGKLRPAYNTQKKVAEKFAQDPLLRDGLMGLIEDVLFLEDPHKKGLYHPRIAAQSTINYRYLDQWHKDAYNALYNDFFYHRHNDFWKESAMKKLPELLSATNMLTCGEDLGMIPDCVPDVMRELQILSLEIQSMPKEVGVLFANVQHYPYLSVCTTSTHDTNPLRAWWEEDRNLSSKFFHEALGFQGDPPYFCEPWVCQRVVSQHLASPSMLAILPIQDWFSIDGDIRRENPNDERINIPAIPRHYWRYRMHIPLEKLLEEDIFNNTVREMIQVAGR